VRWSWGGAGLASVSPRVVSPVAKFRARGLWAALGLLLLLLVVRPAYRQGLAVAWTSFRLVAAIGLAAGNAVRALRWPG
jgi:hypothetical protein